MPSSRAQSQAARSPRAAGRSQSAPNARPGQGGAQRATRPRRVERTLPTSKVRWDRKFRVVMVVVFALVGWIGVRAGLALLNTHTLANQELQLVSKLAQSNHALDAQIKALGDRRTIISDARSLGMVKRGERAYSVVGLDPGN